MSFRNVLLAGVMLAIPAMANAQPVTGPYVSLSGGANFEESTAKTFRNDPPVSGPGPGPFSQTLKDGYAVSGSAGWGFGNGLRVEIEGSYRSNPLNHLETFAGQFSYSGSDTKTAVMVNALYDFAVDLPIFPYIGAGVGAVQDKFDGGKSYRFPTIFPGLGSTNLISQDTITGSTTVVGIQAIAGFSYPIAQVPGLSLTLDYKFFAMPWKRTLADRTDLSCAVPGSPLCFGYTHLSATGNGSYGSDFNHSVMVGVRYAFGGPVGAMPAAAAPAPAPAPVVAAVQPARSYLVFFDWDKADLNARAQQIIAEAAQAATKVKTRIEVAGYADRTGTAAYNQALSLRRANNVAAELVRLGVAKSEISISAFGDTRPLVPTAPNTREPQNRRVEIVLK